MRKLFTVTPLLLAISVPKGKEADRRGFKTHAYIHKQISV